MKILSVAAPGNGSGKTLTLAAILSAWPGRFDTVKFTTVFKDGVNCPRTERACACRELHGRFTVVTDPVVLATEDTDTGRLTRAGAHSVLWCLTQAGAHAEAWQHLRDNLLAAAELLLTEGNSIIPFLAPDLLVMVMSPMTPRERWKSDTWPLVSRAHVVIINSHESGPSEIEPLAAEVAAVRGGQRPLVEDVSRPLAAWSGSLLARSVERLTGDPMSPVREA